ncbi:MFS transporter [Glycomyces terrestris]|uniref:MFS transporter n=1 Tax=Glycomyces terrestris TaxID=2493553 RepID=A0A426UT21_9ACTN|nr:MFS transporter [Glycomyces terrestris]RRR96777.1 MFS transporter [Glycomyces terrestris]
MSKRSSPDAAFWSLASAFTVTMLGTTLPTPLYVLYQREMHFSTLTSTVIFAAYAVGVLGALLLFGRASDVIGRRKILLPGLACAALSAVVFWGADSVPVLLGARLLSGLSAGMFTGTATAALQDLSGDGERATVVATVANMGGLGLGPLLAGVLAQFAAAPLQVPYVVHLVLLAVVAAGVWAMPEPVRIRGFREFRLSRPSVPASVRRTFAWAATAGFAGFAVLGLFTAVAPFFLRELLGLASLALAGVVVCAVFAASALGQVLLVRPLGRAAISVGCGVLVIGVVLLAGALAAGSLVLLLIAAGATGLGQGVSFRAALTALNAAAPAHHRAEVASAFFIVAYIAISIPVVGAGLVAQTAGLRVAGIVFSAAMAALAAVAAIASRRQPAILAT